MQPDYQVIRAFFNSQLERESLPESTLKLYGDKIAELWQLDQRKLCNENIQQSYTSSYRK